jgi:hypothetical protein
MSENVEKNAATELVDADLSEVSGGGAPTAEGVKYAYRKGQYLYTDIYSTKKYPVTVDDFTTVQVDGEYLPAYVCITSKYGTHRTIKEKDLYTFCENDNGGYTISGHF